MKRYIFVSILSLILLSCKEVKFAVPLNAIDSIDIYGIEINVDDKLFSRAIKAFNDSLKNNYSCSEFNYIMVNQEINEDTSDFYLYVVSPSALSIFATSRDTFFFTNIESTLFLINANGPFLKENVQALAVNFNLSECESYLRESKCYLFSANFRMKFVNEEADSIRFQTDCMVLNDAKSEED